MRSQHTIAAALRNRGQDANELWPEHVEATLGDLGRRLGQGIYSDVRPSPGPP